MHRFLNHDSLASGFFNADYHGGTGVYRAWVDHCHNDDFSLRLLVDRLESDYESLTVKMRRPWAGKDVEP